MYTFLRTATQTSLVPMRRLFTLALIVSALSFAVPLTTHAQTITHAGLVDLYLALDIIPGGLSAEEARAVAQNTQDTLSLPQFVELMIALDIVPVAKAGEARAVIAGSNDYAQPIDIGAIHVTPIQTTTRVLRGPFVDRGIFTITFTMTAHEETVYIPRDPSVATRAFLLGGRHSELAPRADQQRITFRSTAPRTGDTYRVEKGTTQQFTLTNTFTPRDMGAWLYYYELGYLHYRTEIGGTLYEHTLPSRDAFRTDAVELSIHERPNLRDTVRAFMKEQRETVAAFKVQTRARYGF